MVSKIEQIIEEIEEMIDGCKYATFSSTKILVDKEEIDELLHELKTHTPDEIMRCQKIISNKEAIMEDAHNKADALLREAQNFSDQMVSEHEIMQQAYAQAGEIVNQAKYQAQEMINSATEQAQSIQFSAMQYTDDSLANIQDILAAAIQETQSNNNNLLNSLSQILNVVNANRAELRPEEEIDRDLAIADRAEAERMMMEAANPESAVQAAGSTGTQGMNNAGAAAFSAAPAPESVTAPAQTPVSDPVAGTVSGTAASKGTNAPVTQNTASPSPDAPAPRAMGGVVRGGIANIKKS